MKSKLKKAVSVLMAFLLMVTVIPESLFASSAAEETTEKVATATDAAEEEPESGEELTAVSAVEAASTLLKSTQLLASSNTATLTNEGNLTVYNNAGYATTATTFHVDVSGSTYPAYCGDHDDHAPASGDYSYYEVTVSNTSNAANIRRIMAYVIDTYGNNYSSIDRETRVKISMAIHNAKNNASNSLGTSIQEAAYAAYKSDPLTGDETDFDVYVGNSGNSTLTVNKTSAGQITVASTGKTVDVYFCGEETDKVFLYGNTGNTLTVTLPDGIYLRYNSTDWAAPGETVTLTPAETGSGNFVRIAVAADFSGTATLNFTGSAGYDVYYLDGGTNYQCLYWGTKTSAQAATITITSPNSGSLSLKKYYESGFGKSYCASLSNYSAGGAVYKVYTTTGNGGSKGSYIGTFTTKTDCNGYVTDVASGYWASSDNKSIEGIEYGSWVYVIETEASKGCQLDTEVHYAQITKNNASVTVTSYEPVNADPLAIKIQKADSVTGETSAAGKGTLSGAEFTVKYYDVDPASYTTLSSISGLTATRTWTFETDENGRIFCNNSSYYTGGDNLYYDGDDIVIPYGVVTIEETSAPLGYTTEGSYFFGNSGTEYTDNVIFATVTEEDGMLYFNGTNFVSADNLTLIKEEQPDRADIKLIKVDAETGEALSGVAFKLTSTTTGESHILVTDKDGVIDTSAISHSTNTNAGDTSYSSGSGVWFYGNTDNSGDIDDSMGALPYDTYVLSELVTDANEGYVLIDDITIDLTDESLYSDGYFLLDLGEIEDIPEPVLGTRVFNIDTNDGVIPADSTVTVYDEVSYSYLTAGKTYTVKGIIMDAETGKAFTDASGNYITGSKTFTLDDDYESYKEEKCGTVTVEYTIDTTGLEGKSLVVYEYLYSGTNTTEFTIKSDGTVDETDVYTTNTGTVIKHTDLTDENQTLYVPEIGTTLTDSETLDHISNPDEEVTLIDTVEYSNLIVGKEYTVSGVLMDKTTGEELLDAEGNTVTASETFTAESTSGTVEIEFTFDASLLSGETTVAFETIYYNETEVAVHADIDDEEQTVYFPNGGTSAIDKSTGTQEGKVSSKVTIIDTVTYENLIVGKEYTVTGVLMDKSTGKEYKDASGNTVTATVTFTAEESTGSVDVEFTFNGSNLAGTSIVVFETIYYNEVEVFTHADISDEGQTVTYPPETTTPPVKTGDNTPITAVIVIFALAVISAGSIFALKRRKRNK